MNAELHCHEVVVLSIAWEPLYKSDWMRAMSDVISGKAEVVQHHDALQARSANHCWKVPSTIRMLSGYMRCKHSKNIPPMGMRLTKRNLWKRDDGRCQYCNVGLSMENATLDHVFPKSRGGKHDWENLVLACGPCNLKKGSKTPGEAKMPLSKNPTKPKPFNVFSIWNKDG